MCMYSPIKNMGVYSAVLKIRNHNYVFFLKPFSSILDPVSYVDILGNGDIIDLPFKKKTS